MVSSQQQPPPCKSHFSDFPKYSFTLYLTCLQKSPLYNSKCFGWLHVSTFYFYFLKIASSGTLYFYSASHHPTIYKDYNKSSNSVITVILDRHPSHWFWTNNSNTDSFSRSYCKTSRHFKIIILIIIIIITISRLFTFIITTSDKETRTIIYTTG